MAVCGIYIYATSGGKIEEIEVAFCAESVRFRSVSEIIFVEGIIHALQSVRIISCIYI